MVNDLYKKVFKSHWAIRDVILMNLDIMDSQEETSHSQFRLLLNGTLTGFITSQLGKCDQDVLEWAVDQLHRYASRPKKNPVIQLQMSRFVSMMECAEDDLSDASNGGIEECLERCAIKVRLHGLPLAMIEELRCLGPEPNGWRLYQSEVNEGYGLLVFDDDESYDRFKEWWRSSAPGLTPPIWFLIGLNLLD